IHADGHSIVAVGTFPYQQGYTALYDRHGHERCRCNQCCWSASGGIWTGFAKRSEGSFQPFLYEWIKCKSGTGGIPETFMVSRCWVVLGFYSLLKTRNLPDDAVGRGESEFRPQR